MAPVFDRFIRHKTRWIGLVAVLGLALLPGILYFGWPGADGYNPNVAVWLRWACLAFSVLLALLVFDRQRAVLSVRSFRTERERKAFLANRKRDRRHRKMKVHPAPVLLPSGASAQRPAIIVDQISALHFSGPLVVIRRQPDVLLQMLLCLVCPFPYLEELTDGWLSDKLGLLMFLRVPWIGLWFVHDESKLFRKRYILAREERSYLSLDHLVALRSLYMDQPLLFVLSFFGGVVLTLSYVQWILERDTSDNGLDIYPTCLAITIMNVIFKWPCDPWTTHMPQTTFGRVTGSLASLSGIILVFLMLGVCYKNLLPKTEEQSALNFVGLRQARKEERTAAASLIQFHWRFRRSLTTIMDAERQETLKARARDRAAQDRQLSRLRNLSQLAMLEGDLDDDRMEARSREPLLRLATVDESSVEFSVIQGSCEAEVTKRYEELWAADAARYKVGCDRYRKAFIKAHRKRLELEPCDLMRKVAQCGALEKNAEADPNTMVRRAFTRATQDAVASLVEQALLRHSGEIEHEH